MKKVLFVYRTSRKAVLEDWKKGKGPDSLLFGANHLEKMGHKIDFFDYSYSPLNLLHPIFYPFEHSIINVTGMGFKLDQAVALLPIFNRYDVIVGTGDSAGLPILFLKYLKIIKKPVIFMTAGLAGALKGKTNTWVGNYYKKILPLADIFTSYSKIEIDFFEKEMGVKNKIKYMPLATDWSHFSQKAKSPRNIICAVGTETGRDYKTFFEAVKDLPTKVIVACHQDNIRGLKIPNNVDVHLNIPVEKVLKIYQRALISVIPCFERYRSSGQMVLLESASAGLPIVASKIDGITTAFEFKEGKHLHFTKPGDVKELKIKILYLLNNPSLANKIGSNASTFVKNKYTTKHLAVNLSGFIEKL